MVILLNEIVNKILEYDYKKINFNEFPLNEKFGLIIKKNNVKFEFILNIKPDTENLIVVGSGALNEFELKKFENKPRFHRNSWDFGESTIFYNDPTRYLNNTLEGGWGIGTPDEWYLETIKNIILEISNYFNYKNEKILFYGSSLGGFTSILLSILVKGSKGLADVPQLTFENTNYWNRIKNIIFPECSDEYIENNFKYRLNVLDLMEKEKYIPNLTIVFDCGNVDISEHYIHFFTELSKLTKCYNENKIKILINPIGKHQFLNKEETLKLIKSITNNENSNDDNTSYSDLFNKYEVLHEKLSELLNKKNIIRIENILFNIPNEFHVFSYNSDLYSYDKITDNTTTLQFTLESNYGNPCINFVNAYINYLKRENGSPNYEKITINNIDIHKVKNNHVDTIRYWFEKDGTVIQIFTYDCNEYTDSNIEYIIRNMEIIKK